MKNNRLYFIDLIRAFAILMMLQGHFIDALLDSSYRDLNSIPYSIWSYFRGITAPTFFTISGLIFTYLMIKAKEKGQVNLRMRKGIIRGLFLIGVGYLIRIPVFAWLSGKFSTYFLVVDVLQCIGLSLILIVGLYFISIKKTLLFSFLCLFLGVIIFLFEPVYRDLNIENIPFFLNNYISKNNGSVFTIIPWFGYVSFGAFIATIFYRYVHKPKFKKIIVPLFFILGCLLIFYSSSLLVYLYRFTKIKLFLDSANYNYLFTRLGNVFLYFSFFYGFEKYLKFPLILKIGQKTLSIYIIHFIVIYGSFTGFGLRQIIGANLTPWQGVFGAIIFLTCICFLAFYYVKPNAFVYNNLRKLFDKMKGK
ncbi:heparan-alpha-glucosaminide N-acetyltransferase domain-containing protein [uncultured Polaribacter sp.]|uniref:heparan-alpha-glucosaminide N-acetyltransferase domain-containing protein n=1 Tax=uncultured Polaribacter sp. TaxID=174711 RepID=UPI0026185149|nr:heparan-alpha-glucosaminide N-acetyltransferase domain-containing protein [uncultured Polaribacter sp.]